MARLTAFSLLLLSLLFVDFAGAHPHPAVRPPLRSAPIDWKATWKALDRNYDACLALDQAVSMLVEFAPTGKVAAVSVEGEPAGSPLEQCLARELKAVQIPAFPGPDLGRAKTIIHRTDCVVITVKSDKPIPIYVDGVLVGKAPLVHRTKVGEHLVTWTTTNGFAMSSRLRRSNAYCDDCCVKTTIKATSWIDPALMVPSGGHGP